MRDLLKDKNYFETYIMELEEMIASNEKSLEEGRIKGDRVPWASMMTFTYKLNKCIAQYSMGSSIDIMKESFNVALRSFKNNEGWIKKVTKVNVSEGIYIDQYMVEPYGKLLRMLSIGYLLNLPKDDFNILVDQIDSDNISDNIYEFIIHAKIDNRKVEREENYDEEKSIILKSYKNIRDAISLKEKNTAENLIKDYLKKDFNHKHSGFYNSHKSRANVYFGYWSFESAAIVIIMDLDDSSFRNNKYYPKDLVDYYRSLQLNS